MGKKKAKIAELKAKIRLLKADLAAAQTHTGGVSPLAPSVFPDLPRIGGVRFATVAAGVKYADRDDVMLAELTSGSAIAGGVHPVRHTVSSGVGLSGQDRWII